MSLESKASKLHCTATVQCWNEIEGVIAFDFYLGDKKVAYYSLKFEGDKQLERLGNYTAEETLNFLARLVLAEEDVEHAVYI